MLAGLLLAAALGAPPATLVRYEVVETTRALTPSGPRVRALAGTVSALGGKARFELSGGRFPGVAARSAIAEGGALVLLDPEASLATPVSREEFDALFQPAPGPEGLATSELKDVLASAVRSGDGTPFDGRPTARWKVSVSFVLVTAQSGRVVRLKHESSGVVETAEPDDGSVPTPFDDLMRLFRVRGAARSALQAELLKVTGLPVRVRLEASTEAFSEGVGPGAAAGAAPPVRATWTTTRTVSAHERRKAKEADAAAFAVPESYRYQPLERARTEGPLPR